MRWGILLRWELEHRLIWRMRRGGTGELLVSFVLSLLFPFSSERLRELELVRTKKEGEVLTFWIAAQNFPKARERLEELRRGGATKQKTRVSRSNMNHTDKDCVVM